MGERWEPREYSHRKQWTCRPESRHPSKVDKGRVDSLTLLCLCRQTGFTLPVSLGSATGSRAYLRGSFSKLGKNLGSVVRDDAQRVVQQGHTLQTWQAAYALDLIQLQEISAIWPCLLIPQQQTILMAAFE